MILIELNQFRNSIRCSLKHNLRENKTVRKSVIVIHDLKRKAIHFTSTKLQGEDLWFPYDRDVSPTMWPVVESLMTLNGIAHNVTSNECIRRCGACEDFKVIYNAPI